MKEFEERDAQVLGISTDARPTQTAYSTSLGGVPYPILADFHPHGKIARAYGLYNDVNGAFKRAVVIIDKQGVVRWQKTYVSAADIKAPEILAELDKLAK